jgi:hypothetical protein
LPSSDDLLSGGPPVDDEETDTPYLGVPKGYAFPDRRPPWAPSFGLGPDKPKPFEPYVKGDEFGPSSLATEDRARLQLALRDAGLYTKNERFQLGVWDQNTRTAYKRLLEYANGAGLDWQAALQDYAAAKEQMGDTAGEGRAPLTVKVSNPADIRKAADAAAQGALGRRLRPDEIDKLVTAYQTLEKDEQTKAYGLAETGGTMTAAPDPGVFLENKAREVDPVGAREYDELGVGNEFFDLLEGSGG